MHSYLITFVLAIVFSIILTPVAIVLAKRWGVMDFPGERRIHKTPLPRMGGAAIYVSFWLAVLLTVPMDKRLIGLLLGSAIIFVVGMVDDIKGMRPLYKLLGQIIAAAVLIFFGFTVAHVTLPIIGRIELSIIGTLFMVIWVVGLVNAVNLSDGMDGLASGICFIAALMLFWSANHIGSTTQSVVMLALAGVTFGFLLFNFHPSKIILGDSGSMFLGYMIGAVSIWGMLKTATVLSLVFPLLVLGIPLIDMLFAVVRRKLKGHSIIRADRGHLHHRLLDTGLSQRQAVIVLYGVSLFFGLAAILATYGHWFTAAVLVVIDFAVIVRIMFRKFRLVSYRAQFREVRQPIKQVNTYRKAAQDEEPYPEKKDNSGSRFDDVDDDSDKQKAKI
ncbi:undecaprenyl/decaprenyl-phosphate alpha-N-acetylglucosaminyl 1-phosphate transferase [Dehalobacter sp. DCM]|uniref:glycosyltransferase family 4 protein n=1 Tax=Dehalobacter sp. DCM TaxID=2907827 RepID=UPI003081B233|nr:undecaprenyl/decaprenyl-phosphate alpha-N-acetylglucosaminyl 1-phosphate transferase [Dehalobacter sp. DCM]